MNILLVLLLLIPSLAGAVTFYVDNTCSTNGNGTTETCGATGPWNTIRNALQVADCTGMQPGDILQINGDAVKDYTCHGAGTNCYFEDNVNVEGACTGIIIQNKTGDHVMVNGTKNIKSSTWTSIGSGVYECQTTGCSGDVDDVFAFRAWYDRGAGEESLDLEQSNQVCDTTLAAGKMRITQSTQRICVHLSNGSSPAAASYFDVPWYWPFLQMGADSSQNMTVRANPSGGSFTVERYRFTGLEADAQSNPGLTIQNMEWTEMLDRCIAYSGSVGNGHAIITGNLVRYCGQEGIRIHGDTGAFQVKNNTVTDIQRNPMFEQCTNVGTGCLSGFSDNGTAIRIINEGGAGGTISGNLIWRVGGGRQGAGRGINLENATSNNIIENNYIAYMQDLLLHGTAIMVSGSFANDDHNGNIIRNNRIYNVDKCFWLDLGSAVTTQAATTNYFVNNTCLEITEEGMEASGSGPFDGVWIVQNNIFDAGSRAPSLMSIQSNATGWTTLQNNGFQCNACSPNQDIIDWKGAKFERDADCTAPADCVADMPTVIGATFTGNDYGSFDINGSGEFPNLQISSTSAGYNTGKTISSQVTTDYAGTSRPQAGSYDMGAHEVISSMCP